MQEARFEDFVGLISLISKEIQRIKAAEAAKLGLKGSDIMCMYYLARHPEGLTAAELARAAEITRAAVSRTLSHLEREGFVDIESADNSANRYRALVRLTERGQTSMDAAFSVIRDVLNSTGDEVGEEDRAKMYDSLQRILERLRTMSRDA